MSDIRIARAHTHLYLCARTKTHIVVKYTRLRSHIQFIELKFDPKEKEDLFFFEKKNDYLMIITVHSLFRSHSVYHVCEGQDI